MAGTHLVSAALLPTHTLSEVPLQHCPSFSPYPVASFARNFHDNNSPSIEEALAHLEKASHLPSLHELVRILQQCRKEKDLALAKRTHQLLRDRNFGAFEELGNYLVPMYIECGSMRDAEEVFDQLPHCNEHSWTSLIQGYTDH
eukprot:c14682_g3_i1 orf=2-430(-)